MRYLILFGIIVALAAVLAIWCARKLGGLATIVIGAILSLSAVVLFVLNKSDSVADTVLEKLADLSPPLITGSVVIGWWLGYALYGFWIRLKRKSGGESSNV